MTDRALRKVGHMEWTTPEFTEISMDAEVGRYQQDDNDPFVAED